MITGSGYISRTMQSLIYFLNNEQYQKDGSTKTLQTEYSGINITVGFPDSLEKLDMPTLAIVSNPTGVQTETFGMTAKFVPVTFSIYGFAGGEQTDGANAYLRDNLCNDVREILEDSEYIDLYDYPNFSSSTGDMSIESVDSRFIEQTGITDADKYRFVVELECEYVKKLG